VILVTGGLGFIGMHLARELASSDDMVLTYHRTRRDPGEVAGVAGKRVRLVKLDVENPYALADAMAATRPDSIVHLAVPGLGALSAADEIATNVTGLVNLLEAARIAGVRRVTIASSVAVYWGNDGPFREDDPLCVASTSATSAMKKAMEVLALHYADRTGLDVVLLRIGMVYGPLYHTLANFPSQVLHYAVKGRPFADGPGSWDVTRLRSGLDLCYVKDCAAAIARLHLAGQVQHRIYNVSGGRAVSAAEVLDAAKAAVPMASFPADLHMAAGQPAECAYMDISRVNNEFGWAPQFSMTDGMADYARWLREHDW
jgi:UDP-glucose 4-epimerase